VIPPGIVSERNCFRTILLRPLGRCYHLKLTVDLQQNWDLPDLTAQLGTIVYVALSTSRRSFIAYMGTVLLRGYVGERLQFNRPPVLD